MATLLALDLCGEKSTVGLFELNIKGQAPLWWKTYSPLMYPEADGFITNFLEEGGLQPDYACIAVPGIVANGSAAMPGESRELTETVLLQKFHFSDVKVISGMTALSSALPTLLPKDYTILQMGQPLGDITAVLAPGNGLGHGLLFGTDTSFYPQGTEGGYSIFSPVDKEQLELLRWLQPKYETVSSATICAVSIISELYEYLKAQGVQQSEEVAATLEQSEDNVGVILNNGLSDNPCPLCKKTVELYLSLLGTEAANLVLRLSARAGIYLGGSFLAKQAAQLPFAPFLEAFRRVGEMQALLEKVPVKVILQKGTILAGVLNYSRNVFSTHLE